MSSARPHLVRYIVRSSDVLADMRVNVSEEGAPDNVVWYKERFLADDEIIEHIVENATSTILWTIHRPSRGWYIRLRTPSFPKGFFISLTPPQKTSPYHVEAALTFACRTNAIPPSLPASASRSHSHEHHRHTSSKGTSPSAVASEGRHSYPPTPTASTASLLTGPFTGNTPAPAPANPPIIVRPPSPRSPHQSVSASPRPPPTQAQPQARSTITHFILAPHAHAPQSSAEAAPAGYGYGFFERVKAALLDSAPVHSYSFSLSPVPPSFPTTPATSPPLASPSPSPSPAVPLSSPAGLAAIATSTTTAPPLVPLLAFHDRTSTFSAGSITGTLELDAGLERMLGVDTGFYVAVALTYLEFLSERESYLAALAD